MDADYYVKVSGMKMKSGLKTLFAVLAVLLLALVSCGGHEGDVVPEVEEPKDSISNVVNPYETRKVSYLGSTVSINFDITASWTASLKLLPETDPNGKEWASINDNTLNGDAKKDCTVRISVKENETAEERVAELWVTMKGAEAEKVAVMTQASSGTTIDASMNQALNTFMHDILKEDYLFAEAYNSKPVDLTVPYTEFLSKHLLALGEANIEDGGYYKPLQANSGQRFIYTSLVEIQPVTRASQVSSLGFGPFLSTALSDASSEMGIAPSYVRRGSPAEKAGLRRGDIIYAVNGTKVTTSNYQTFMNRLYQNATGTYSFSFLRFESNGQENYSLKAYESVAAYAGPHLFDPILHASILKYPEKPEIKIGYLVFETFDLNSQEFLAETMETFISEGITDLILDLRFNYGGAVAQSRWLSGCIAGKANWDKTFCKVVYNDGKTENWTFGNGYTADTDNLGKPKDLGLKRLFVIGSYNTASASELLINSLRGIDFPVKLIGSSTEGKNVGMNVSRTEYKGRQFQFQPVTFYVRNAKDFGDYADGFKPDEYVNNDNALLTDDADNVFPYSFSDWGNMDYNIALQWAYCDITGKQRWTSAPNSRSVTSVTLHPDSFQPMEHEPGRYGNLVFENQ